MPQVQSAAGSALDETKKAGAAVVDAAGTAAGNVADAVKDAAKDDNRSPVVQQVAIGTTSLRIRIVLSVESTGRPELCETSDAVSCWWSAQELMSFHAASVCQMPFLCFAAGRKDRQPDGRGRRHKTDDDLLNVQSSNLKCSAFDAGCKGCCGRWRDSGGSRRRGGGAGEPLRKWIWPLPHPMALCALF